MSYLTKNLKQTAVYWARTTPRGSGGWNYSDGVEVICRWEEEQEIYKDTQGKEFLSNAVVYLAQDVLVDGVLFLGELTDIDSDDLDDPLNVDGAYTIKRFFKVPNIKATSFERRAVL
jgi:hypothetical protein